MGIQGFRGTLFWGHEHLQAVEGEGEARYNSTHTGLPTAFQRIHERQLPHAPGISGAPEHLQTAREREWEALRRHVNRPGEKMGGAATPYSDASGTPASNTGAFLIQ